MQGTPLYIMADFLPLIQYFSSVEYYYPVFGFYPLPRIFEDAAALPLGSAARSEIYEEFISEKVHDCLVSADLSGELDKWIDVDYDPESVIESIVAGTVRLLEAMAYQQDLWGGYVFYKWVDEQQTLMLLIHHDTMIEQNEKAQVKNTGIYNMPY